MFQYMEAFSNNNVDGERLINLRPSTLEAMGIECIGHQEIILEAVEHLRNFVRSSILFPISHSIIPFPLPALQPRQGEPPIPGPTSVYRCPLPLQATGTKSREEVLRHRCIDGHHTDPGQDKDTHLLAGPSSIQGPSTVPGDSQEDVDSGTGDGH